MYLARRGYPYLESKWASSGTTSKVPKIMAAQCSKMESIASIRSKMLGTLEPSLEARRPASYQSICRAAGWRTAPCGQPRGRCCQCSPLGAGGVQRFVGDCPGFVPAHRPAANLTSGAAVEASWSSCLRLPRLLFDPVARVGSEPPSRGLCIYLSRSFEALSSGSLSSVLRFSTLVGPRSSAEPTSQQLFKQSLAKGGLSLILKFSNT